MAEKREIHDFADHYHSRYKNPQTESTFTFQGTLQKMQLVSNNISYGRCPAPEDEVEQRLTIREDGRVWLSRYRYGSTGKHDVLMEKQQFRISPEAAAEIMEAVSGYFGNAYDIDFVTDVGAWNIVLTNTEGKQFKMTGPLCCSLQTASGDLSDLIRANLHRNDLFVFDGKPEFVVRIEIQYHRIMKIKPAVIPEDAAWEYVTWDYHESLTLDHGSDTMEHVREIGPGCRITNYYYVQDGISHLLGQMDLDAFSEIEGNPPDVVEDPLDRKEYTITLYTNHGNTRKVTGTFDRRGLPTDWPEFIDDIYDFMAFYGLGELFNERIYGKAKRRASDYIFCNVLFEEGGITYCYLADSDDYCEGDLVVVPAGRDNHEAVVRIESIEYCSEEEVPFPVEKTKHIRRKYEGEEEE